MRWKACSNLLCVVGILLSDKVENNSQLPNHKSEISRLSLTFGEEKGKKMERALTLKLLSKIVAEDILFYFICYFSEKIWLCISCELAASQTIHMKWQAFFSLKSTKEYQNIVCCSYD